MNIYEVVFWGSHGDGDAEDTIYLVRAPDYLSAVEDVICNGSPSEYNARRLPLVDAVYEVAHDLSPHAEEEPRILRGPYFAFAYNYGWRSWSRHDEGPELTPDVPESQVNDPGNATEQ